MTQVATLVGKEVRTLFTSPIAYAVIAVFVVLSGYTFTVSLIVAKQATLVHIFFQAAVQLILLVPLITMRQFAEERRSGTLQLLLTAPLREVDIVAAKFIACMVVLVAMTSLTLIYAAVLAAYGDPDWGPIYSGYVGLVMLGAALVSIGLMISALTANQIVAAVVSLGLFGILWAIDTLASLLPQPVWRSPRSTSPRRTPRSASSSAGRSRPTRAWRSSSPTWRPPSRAPGRPTCTRPA